MKAVILVIGVSLLFTTAWAGLPVCDEECDENAECNYNNTCVCLEGYTGNGTYCVDFCGGSCVENAFCDYYGYCVCDSGYTGDGYSYCYDIDECSYDPEYYCGYYANCTNTNGGYTCECIEGYEDYGEGCTRSCNDTCGQNTYCYDAMCYCNPGYTGDPDIDCIDFDECEYNSTYLCGDNANCINIDGGYYCECFEGYTDYGDGCTRTCNETCAYNAYCYDATCYCYDGYTGDPYTNCSDFNECSYNSTYYCGEYAYCYNTIGSYYCVCFEGYTGYGSDCTTLCGDSCVENAYCNYYGNCVCDSGYTGDGYFDCYDIDECSYDPYYYCGYYANCTNFDGGYLCECYEGYTDYGDGCTRTCTETCAYNAYCYNATCSCDYGYTGDPYSNCTDINECLLNSTYYCGDYAYCYNTDGSYYCECFDGYTGYGGDCTELCGEPCGYNAYCYDGQCYCEYGYTGDPYYECYDINECYYYDDDEGVCGDAYCINTNGSYTCYCEDGYYYSEVFEDCIPIEGPYEVPGITIDGCNPEVNEYARYKILEHVQAFIEEKLYIYYQYHDYDDYDDYDDATEIP